MKMTRKQVIQVCTESKKCRNRKMHVHNGVQVQLEQNAFFQLKPNGKWVASDQAKQFLIALHFYSRFWCHKTFWIFSIFNINQKGNVWVNKKSRTSSLIIPKAFWYAVISILNRTGKIHVANYILKQKKKASIKNTSYKRQFCSHQAKLITSN